MINSLLAILLAFLAVASSANTLTSVDIANVTLKATLKSHSSCLRYQVPRRFCVWLSPWLGKNVTPFLDHYSPDLIVMVYRNKDDNPWSEARVLLDKASAAAQTRVIAQMSALSSVGSGNHSLMNVHEQEVIFKEADVVGNPAIPLFSNAVNALLLPSTATPMKPYFQSMLDSILWRGLMPASIPEEGAAVALNVVHHVGKGLVDWGGIYPHEGTVIGNNDAKASIVIAQRAADLLTNTNPFSNVHIKQSLTNTCGEHCNASPITENSDDTLFQLIYPIEETDCVPLGSDESYDLRMLNEKGAYAWIVWRHYQGCVDGEGKFVGVFP